MSGQYEEVESAETGILYMTRTSRDNALSTGDE